MLKYLKTIIVILVLLTSLSFSQTNDDSILTLERIYGKK